MKLYLDNCCFNRPFDDQASLIVSMETEAKLHVQDLIRQGEFQLCRSFVLDYENGISAKATQLMSLGLRQMDASHIACAIYFGADYFLTTDKKVLNKRIAEIPVLNPIDFVRRYLDV